MTEAKTAQEQELEATAKNLERENERLRQANTKLETEKYEVWMQLQGARCTVDNLRDQNLALVHDILVKDAACDRLMEIAKKLEARAVRAERANGALVIAAGLGYVAGRHRR